MLPMIRKAVEDAPIVDVYITPIKAMHRERAFQTMSGARASISCEAQIRRAPAKIMNAPKAILTVRLSGSGAINAFAISQMPMGKSSKPVKKISF